MRRQPGEWMNPVDDRILEFLAAEGASSPKIVADGLGNHPEYVGGRLRTLTDYDLVDRPGRGVYRITDAGEAYLAGELDAGELEADEE